ncbi:MAG: hypothetical protein AAB597_03225 [Patescibacteria group bacterium]
MEKPVNTGGLQNPEKLLSVYKSGLLQEGGSKQVDEIIVEILYSDKERENLKDPAKFRQAWNRFLVVALEKYPNMSVFNLAGLELALEANEYKEEALFVSMLIRDIGPVGTESRIWVGHNLKNLGRYPEALLQYTEALNILKSKISQETELREPAHQWLDMSGINFQVACCYLKMEMYAEAISALELAKNQMSSAFSDERVPKEKEEGFLSGRMAIYDKLTKIILAKTPSKDVNLEDLF